MLIYPWPQEVSSISEKPVGSTIPDNKQLAVMLDFSLLKPYGAR